MKIFSDKDIYFNTFVVTAFASIILFVLAAECFFLERIDIPFGILLGGIYNAIFYLFISLLSKRKIHATIVVLIIRFVLFAGIMVLNGFMFYKWGVKIFNPFTLVGGYLLGTIIYIITLNKEGQK